MEYASRCSQVEDGEDGEDAIVATSNVRGTKSTKEGGLPPLGAYIDCSRDVLYFSVFDENSIKHENEFNMFFSKISIDVASDLQHLALDYFLIYANWEKLVNLRLQKLKSMALIIADQYLPWKVRCHNTTQPNQLLRKPTYRPVVGLRRPPTTSPLRLTRWDMASGEVKTGRPLVSSESRLRLARLNWEECHANQGAEKAMVQDLTFYYADIIRAEQQNIEEDWDENI